MPALWRLCKTLCKKEPTRRNLFLFLNTFLFALLGFVLWLILRQWTLKTWDWAIVFAGGAGYFIGLLGGAIYLYNV